MSFVIQQSDDAHAINSCTPILRCNFLYFLITVEPLLLAEPTFSDQNTNLYLAAFNISDVYIENTIITMLVLTSASNST